MPATAPAPTPAPAPAPPPAFAAATEAQMDKAMQDALFGSDDEDDVIFFVADQINQMINSTKATSPPSLMDIARINDLAGSKACDKSDFNSAYAYFSTAVESLPGGWEDHYDLTLRVRFQMARCAYSCGLLGKSYDMLTTIVDKGRCIEDKLESYNMITIILHARQSMDEACGTSQKVLRLLGEDSALFSDVDAF